MALLVSLLFSFNDLITSILQLLAVLKVCLESNFLMN